MQRCCHSPPAAFWKLNSYILSTRHRSFMMARIVPVADGDENEQRQFAFGTTQAKAVTGGGPPRISPRLAFMGSPCSDATRACNPSNEYIHSPHHRDHSPNLRINQVFTNWVRNI